MKLLKSPVAQVFNATRLPAKRLTFALQAQQSFSKEIRTSILISQYTVSVLALGADVETTEFGLLLSRFFMHDLTKITSRKSSNKVITFYFRIPTFMEY